MPFGFNFEKQALSSFLKEAKFPATKQQLVDLAKSKADLPHQVFSQIQNLTDRQFTSAEDVQKDLHVSVG